MNELNNGTKGPAKRQTIPRSHVRLMYNNDLIKTSRRDAIQPLEFPDPGPRTESHPPLLVGGNHYMAGPYQLRRPLPPTDVRLQNANGQRQGHTQNEWIARTRNFCNMVRFDRRLDSCNLLSHLQETVRETLPGHDFQQYRTVTPANVPIQLNEFDCAIFVIQHMQYHGTHWWIDDLDTRLYKEVVDNKDSSYSIFFGNYL
ncbi:hypothetical protein ACLB2K_016703 [Fragaria x ananassa]